MSNRSGMYGRPASFSTEEGVMEPVPADALADDDEAHYGGTLFFNLEVGLAGCSNPECGWSGVPTIVRSVISTWCPKCQPGHRPGEGGMIVLPPSSPTSPRVPLSLPTSPASESMRRRAEREARRKRRKKSKR